ncbi:4-(cytidine 5'-diphospho)-2-C-methyl-D-erythritol kinase [Candidatus Ichthyocystis sparus]|uniref:4-(cytidine 5'-diphospho)-2-C-methyl-D-erythritol kinase n=1 Tax=Candidatus Ichthyocystis sparus TaxID=1561004 RepID=UPI000AE2B0CB|nr:4-(cytidine 5'-diphospho)-2-C-methyl-D-erythritol kinase [Candidatus Ichthyocystis sparus]
MSDCKYHINRWWSPAKINLFLNVVNKRSDGYHKIQTGLVNITLCDTMSYHVTRSKNIHIDVQGLPTNCSATNNLAYKAAKLLQEKTGTSRGCRISLKKAIPTGSGLAGGSSNAATTLIALNLLWEINISNQQLQHIGLQLGQDVPFFISGKPSWGIEKGGIIKTIPDNNFLIPQYCILIAPRIHVTSATIYENLKEPRGKIYQLFDKKAYQHGNDLEETVLNLHPNIKDAKTWLSNWGIPQISGSGGSIFCLLEKLETAIEIARNPKTSQLGDVFVTKILRQHPHYHMSHNFYLNSSMASSKK